MNTDVIYGTSKETFVMNILNIAHNLNLKQSDDKYSVFDFYDYDKKVAFELKSRRVKFGTYPTTMIGYNKISKGLEMIKEGWKIGLCFYFVEDMLCTYRLREDFDHSWVKYNTVTRYDRGGPEISSVAMIPNSTLKKLLDWNI